MMTWFNRHGRLRERLSAYIDGQLDAGEMREIDEHLARCDACRRELDELRLTVSAVREMAWLEAPRSFRLTPEQVSPQRRTAPASSVVGNGMRLAGAALAFALAVVLVVDTGNIVGGNGEEGGTVIPQSVEHAPMSEPLPAETPGAGPGSIAERTEVSPNLDGRDEEAPMAGATPLAEGETLEDGAAEMPAEAPRMTGAEPAAQAGPGALEQGDGISALRLAEIALAAALALVIVSALARSLLLRRW
jgi:hypothetical protein